MLPLLVLMGTIAGAWYLLIVRPQKDQRSLHGRLVERLQVGDHVLTVGGIYGRVVEVAPGSVVLELAPGLTSRISTDGIARIVQGSEANLATTTSPRSTDDTMQHQHPAPQPPAETTFRAQVDPGSTPVAPQPWPQHQPVHYAPVPAPVQYAPAPVQYAPAPVQYAPAPIQYAPAPVQYAPAPVQPVLVHTPFAPPVAPQLFATPVAPAAAPEPMRFAVPVTPQAHVAPAGYAQPLPAAHPVAAAQEATARRHSRAPQGMGSSLRLDDPSLADSVARARNERVELAQEYQRMTAPLVDTTPAHVAPVAIQATPMLPTVGSEVPAPAPRAHYPGPVRPPSADGGIPRPAHVVHQGPVDPAFQSAAFQRRTPYAAEPVEALAGAAPA
ncbi:MAG: preprotein translocase subunit YajC [Thermoleophilia bacterium]|nr:preprotein translocase subunit YajC [Thermoleophilia bacterium]